jgi:hypothetical protein
MAEAQIGSADEPCHCWRFTHQKPMESNRRKHCPTSVRNLCSGPDPDYAPFFSRGIVTKGRDLAAARLREKQLAHACLLLATSPGACPTGKLRMRAMRKLPVVPLCRSRAVLLETPNQRHLPRVPLSQEGRFAVVTDVESGMRWTLWLCVDERSLKRTAKSCGPGVPTLALSWRWCLASRR